MTGFHLSRGDLHVQSTAGEIELVRLSPEGLVFHPAPGARVDGVLQVDLVPGQEPLSAEVEAHELDGSARARWQPMALCQARELQRHIQSLFDRRLVTLPSVEAVEHERILAPDRVRAVLHTLFANRCSGRVQAPGARGGWIRIAAGRIEPESPMPLQWESEELWPDPPFRIVIDGYSSLVDFEVREAREVDGFLAVPVPTELRRVRSRTQRRAKVTGEVVFSFAHPRWPELRVRRRVRDVSLDGMQIVCSAVKDLVYPGLQLPQATVTWDDRLVCTVAAEVRHVADDIDGEAELAGLRLSFTDEHDRLHFREKVEALLYPNTRSDGTWAQQLWDLYRASGYLELSHKAEPEFVALKEAFTRSSERLARSDLGIQVVWPSSRGLEASLSILRPYERGAFIYQLARRQGRVPMRFPGRAILRDVYQHAIEDLQRHSDVEWLIVWIQKEARFSKLVHVDMPRRYLESGRVLMWPFRALEADVGALPAAPPDGVELAQASVADRDRFFEHLQRTRSHHYIDAHDLSPDTFDQRKLRGLWSAAGFHRGRELWVARRGGRAIAFSLCESADDGLHLFRLLDVVRLYALEEDGQACFPALVGEARRWFAGQGKQRFIVFAEPDQIEALRTAQLHDLGEADVVLLPAQLLPELLEHVYEVTAPRDLPKLRGA